MAEVALGLGSNLGNREEHLTGALRMLAADELIRLTAISSLWETPPWGVDEQPHFLNACVVLETSRSPMEMLEICLEIERGHGRERSVRWGARTLDMDVLYYDDLEQADEVLTLPHPRMLVRSFVLAPLAEIAPGKVIGGVTVGDWLAQVGMEPGMRKLGPLSPADI